jgi:hypothetical protein
MKTILVILTAAVFGSCYSSSQVQVEMVDAQLVRIDTVFRYETYRSQYPWQREQQLTWRDSYNKQYVFCSD